MPLGYSPHYAGPIHVGRVGAQVVPFSTLGVGTRFKWAGDSDESPSPTYLKTSARGYKRADGGPAYQTGARTGCVAVA